MNPTSKSVFEIVEAFKSVLPMAKLENHLDMGWPIVCTPDHLCGTIHCHAGWYAIAIGLHKTAEYVSFSAGTLAMALHLGFEEGIGGLLFWARDTKIWGNNRGYAMFFAEDAFYHDSKRPYGAENLQDIIDHWTEVGERLRELERKKEKVVHVYHAVEVPESIWKERKMVLN